jgi:hypothetical protein
MVVGLLCSIVQPKDDRFLDVLPAQAPTGIKMAQLTILEKQLRTFSTNQPICFQKNG